MELYHAEEDTLFRNIYNKKISTPPTSFKNEKQPLTKEELDYLVKTLSDKEEWQMVAYVYHWSGSSRSETAQLLKEVFTYEKVKVSKSGELKDYYMTHPVRCKGKEGNVRKLVLCEEAMNAIKKWSFVYT